MPNYQPKSSFIIILILTIAPLSVAYIAEYLFNIIPCKLCIYQRVPYIIIGLLSMANLILPLKETYSKYSWTIIEITLIESFSLSLFHYGVEKKFFKFYSNYTNSLQTSENFKKIITIQDYVPCDQVNFEIFGISASFLNILYAIFFFVLVIRLAKIGIRNEK